MWTSPALIVRTTPLSGTFILEFLFMRKPLKLYKLERSTYTRYHYPRHLIIAMDCYDPLAMKAANTSSFVSTNHGVTSHVTTSNPYKVTSGSWPPDIRIDQKLVTNVLATGRPRVYIATQHGSHESWCVESRS